MSGEPSVPDPVLDRLLRAAAETELREGPPRYEVLREIGRGGMGVVFEAEDTVLHRRVALKRPLDSSGWNRDTVARFAREALAAARLHHQNICPVFDASAEGIAMQLIDGTTLDTLPAVADRVRVALLRDAARAVHAAHVAGIVHRDLKPANLMVEGRPGSDLRVYVMDFGLAKETEVDSTLSRSGHLLGTPAFMAPELARGERTADARSDVYGLGATLYAALLGAPPYQGLDPLQVLRQVVEAPPPSLHRRRPETDRDLATILATAMAPDPDRRYQTAAAFADDLDRWLEGLPVVARPPSLTYRTRLFLRRRRGAVLSTALATAVTGVALLLVWAGERGGRQATERALSLSNTINTLLEDARDALLAGYPEVHRARLEQALVRCAEAAEEDGVPQAHFQHARILFRLQRHTEAIAALDRTLAQAPAFTEAKFLRGLVQLEYLARPADRGGPHPMAVGHLLRQARTDLKVHEQSTLSVRRVDMLYGEARLALLDGELQRAELLLAEVVERLDPFHRESLRSLANLIRESHPDQALVYDARALDLERGWGWQVLRGFGTDLRALEALAAGAIPSLSPPRDPEDAATWRTVRASMEQAARAHREGNLTAARAAWHAVLDQLAPILEDEAAPAGLRNDLGVVHSHLESLAQGEGSGLLAANHRRSAITAFERAVEQDSRLVEGWCNLGASWERHGEGLARNGYGEAVAEVLGKAVAAWQWAQHIADRTEVLTPRIEAALARLGPPKDR